MAIIHRLKIIALFAAVLAVAAAFVLRNDALTLDVFNVGQGDAILVQSGRRQMLIDGGPDRAVISKIGAAMPFFDRTIEFIVLTHPHADHFVGLISVLEKYRVKTVIIPGGGDSPEYAALIEALRNSEARAFVAKRGDSVEFGGSARFAVLWPGFESVAATAVSDRKDPNDESIVLRLTVGNDAVRAAALFMGDATSNVEAALLASGEPLEAGLLKVGHHGSRYSSSSEFVDRVSPDTAVVSVGKNRYGHPTFEALMRLRASAREIWRTDRDGDYRAVYSRGRFLRRRFRFMPVMP